MPRSSVEPRLLTADVQIDAPPSTVWTVVADVRRTGEWSPECTRVLLHGAPRRGRLMLGINRRGRVRWATVSRVRVHEPEREIGWTVLTNRAEWTYRLEETGSGTRLVETRRTPRGEGVFTNRLLGGQAPHDDELEAGMRTSLERIRHLVLAGDRP